MVSLVRSIYFRGWEGRKVRGRVGFWVLVGKREIVKRKMNEC